jgi:hypothetical protein
MLKPRSRFERSVVVFRWHWEELMEQLAGGYQYLSDTAVYSTIFVGTVIAGVTIVMSFAFYRTTVVAPRRWSA